MVLAMRVKGHGGCWWCGKKGVALRHGPSRLALGVALFSCDGVDVVHAPWVRQIPDVALDHLPRFAKEQATYRTASGNIQRRKAQFVVLDYHPETFRHHRSLLPVPLPYGACLRFALDLIRVRIRLLVVIADLAPVIYCCCSNSTCVVMCVVDVGDRRCPGGGTHAAAPDGASGPEARQHPGGTGRPGRAVRLRYRGAIRLGGHDRPVHTCT